MAAYLADDDADVHNLTVAAVRKDALTAALRLTALAADAVVEPAALRKPRPEQVLQSLTEGPPDPANHRPEHPPLAVQVVYPAPIDDHDWAMTEAKGWIAVTVRSTEGEKVITFYDPVRSAQEVRDAMKRSPGHFAESAVVVVPTAPARSGSSCRVRQRMDHGQTLRHRECPCRASSAAVLIN